MSGVLTVKETLTLLGFTPEQVEAMMRTAGLWGEPQRHSSDPQQILTIDNIATKALDALTRSMTITRNTNHQFRKDFDSAPDSR